MAVAVAVIAFFSYAAVVAYSLRHWGPGSPSGAHRWRQAMLLGAAVLIGLVATALLTQNDWAEVGAAALAFTLIAHVLGALFSGQTGMAGDLGGWGDH